MGQGIIMQYGTVTNPVDTNIITFPVPFTSVPYNIQLTSVNIGSSNIRTSVQTGTVLTTQFQLNITSNPDFLYWMAIGAY